jgi:crotonobetainyl-CoA:carnitine CoA-transferase CaiB-like acyl-CoA transferase
MKNATATSSTPLVGVTVIELGHSVAAPFAGQVLADLGARVIKVENPGGGDDARHWGPPFWHGAASAFQSLNRNKLSITADLKDEGQLAKLKALMLNADVVLQNMRPGLVSRYGLGAEQLRLENPRLIYCNLGAFGSVGPLKDSTGYDPLVQAFSGIMSVTGENGRPPVRVGPSIIDQGAGMWSVIGILTALINRNNTAQGCTVDTSLYETALSWMTIPIASALASGKEPGKSGSETPMLVPYRAFSTADRFVVIAAGNNNLFSRLVSVLGHPEWANDERFRDNSDRVANRVELNALIEDVVCTQPADHWVSTLDAVGVPCAPVQTVSQVLAHPQTSALGMMPQTPDGQLQLIATPLQFDGHRPAVRSSPPSLGAHSLDELLASYD